MEHKIRTEIPHPGAVKQKAEINQVAKAHGVGRPLRRYDAEATGVYPKKKKTAWTLVGVEIDLSEECLRPNMNVSRNDLHRTSGPSIIRARLERPSGQRQVDISMNMPSPELYQELREIAKRLMLGERKGHTLSPTDLLHEAYTRLCPTLSSSPGGKQEPNDATYRIETLPSLFATTMRRVLIDHARKRVRRNSRLARVGWVEPSGDGDSVLGDGKGEAAGLIEVDEILTRFAMRYPMYAKVVELKFFGGLTVVQCAEEIGVCPATAQRYWNFARAWIAREIERRELE